MKKITWYFLTLWEMVSRPIYFFSKKDEQEWWEGSLTFAMLTAWIIALAATIVIFITQYVPVGMYMTDRVSGFKYLMVSPVIIAVALDFLIMTWVLLGGILMIGWFCLFYLLGAFFHFICLLAKGTGKIEDSVKASFYSSGVLLFMIISAFFALLVRRDILTGQNFIVGVNLLGFLVGLYIYGLWSIFCRKIYRLAKWKAFIVAAVPFLMVLLVGFIISMKALPKILGVLQ